MFEPDMALSSQETRWLEHQKGWLWCGVCLTANFILQAQRLKGNNSLALQVSIVPRRHTSNLNHLIAEAWLLLPWRRNSIPSSRGTQCDPQGSESRVQEDRVGKGKDWLRLARKKWCMLPKRSYCSLKVRKSLLGSLSMNITQCFMF